MCRKSSLNRCAAGGVTGLISTFSLFLWDARAEKTCGAGGCVLINTATHRERVGGSGETPGPAGKPLLQVQNDLCPEPAVGRNKSKAPPPAVGRPPPPSCPLAVVHTLSALRDMLSGKALVAQVQWDSVSDSGSSLWPPLKDTRAFCKENPLTSSRLSPPG